MSLNNWTDIAHTPAAVGDGVSDDTAVIQAAINAAGNGGVVLFPAGKLYRITSTLTAAFSNHTWIMYGSAIYADVSGVAVRFGSVSTAYENCSVHGGSVYRNASLSGGVVVPGSVTWNAGDIGWQWLNVSRYQHTDYYIHGFEIGQQLFGTGTVLFTFTVTSGSPATFNKTAHGLSVGAVVYMTNVGGALPAGLAANTAYYVLSTGNPDTFQLSLTSGGAAVNTASAGTGTQYLLQNINGTQYGHLVPRHIVSCKYGIYLYADNGGWCNENAFYGAGRVGTVSSDPNATGGILIYLNRTPMTSNALCPASDENGVFLRGG